MKINKQHAATRQRTALPTLSTMKYAAMALMAAAFASTSFSTAAFAEEDARCPAYSDQTHKQIVVDLMRIHSDKKNDNSLETDDEIYVLSIVKTPGMPDQIVRLPSPNSYWNIREKQTLLSGDNSPRRVACVKLAKGETAKISLFLIDDDNDAAGRSGLRAAGAVAKWLSAPAAVVASIVDKVGKGGDDIIGYANLEVTRRMDGTWTSISHGKQGEVLRCRLDGRHANSPQDCGGDDVSAIHYFFDNGHGRYDFDFWIHT